MKYDKDRCKIKHCNKCDISIKSNIVNGYGDINSGIVIIGESPGYYENKYKIPFVGRSGDLLNSLLTMIGLSRDMVYVTNVIKCQPHASPTATEVNNCSNYLKYELWFAKPKIIVLLGSLAIKSYFGSKASIKQLRDKAIINNNTIVYSLYHPSFILRNSDKTGLVKYYINKFKQIGSAYKYYIDGTHTKIW